MPGPSHFIQRVAASVTYTWRHARFCPASNRASTSDIPAYAITSEQAGKLWWKLLETVGVRWRLHGAQELMREGYSQP